MDMKKHTTDAITKVESIGAGHVHVSELHQTFNLWSTLGVAFSYIATPLSIGSYLAFSLSAGGSPFFFYGYLASFILNTMIALSLCEMAGFLPHTSGQVFWTSRLAPRPYARALSYFNGGVTVMAWLFWTAGTYLFTAQLLLAYVSLLGATWHQSSYQVFLLYVTFALYALFINTFGFKAMPLLSKFMIGFINIGALFVLVTLLVRSHPKPSAREVFIEVVNETGWSSDGLVFFLSLLPGVTAINGFDSAAHLAEELPHPAKEVPQVMIGTVLLCGFAGLPMVIAFLYSIVKPENLLTSAQPVFQLFYDSFNSKPLFVIAGLIYLGLFIFASGSITTTTSRVWWSFARNGALPCPDWQGRVNDRLTLPVNAIVVVVVVEILIGLLVFGPATVLTGLVGSAAICFYISYAMPILCFLVRGRENLPKTRYFNLGVFGPYINIVALSWASIMSVFLCFPTFVPVTANLMNYASAVVATGMTIWTIFWFTYARKHYRAPEPLYDEALHGAMAPSTEPSEENSVAK